MTGRPPSAGYDRIRVGRAEAVAVRAAVPLLRDALARGTLYEAARRHPGSRELQGRQPAYSMPLDGGAGRVVVRHNRHGGLLAAITGDRFLYPTRAPRELDASTRLAAAGVPTPEMLGYVVYRALGAFARSDVMTRMVEPSRDLAAALAKGDDASHRKALDLTATLVAALSRAGARHEDLNAKNVLLGAEALVLDVDRVAFGYAPRDALALNLARLDRSLRKRRERFGERISDAEIAALGRWAAERM